MSKVVHLSDEAHTAAKNFCKQHGLKMSDWVAELIAEAISEVRVEPKTKPRLSSAPAVAPAPAPAPAPVAHVSQAAPAPAAPSGPAKKKLARYDDSPKTEDGLQPWAAPPFWSRAQSK